jgi:hypothetical protein
MTITRKTVPIIARDLITSSDVPVAVAALSANHSDGRRSAAAGPLLDRAAPTGSVEPPGSSGRAQDSLQPLAAIASRQMAVKRETAEQLNVRPCGSGAR